MKKIFILSLFLLFFSPAAFAQTNFFQGTEHIKNFDSSITINKDGTVRVEETIIYDFGPLERHGIYREIPYVKPNRDGKKYEMTFSDFEVTDENGLNWNFETSTQSELFRVKIGDANKTITGVHTYKIDYTVAGALTYFDDHDELYWNATGNDWNIPIASATATVIIPTVTAQTDLKTACYTGTTGSSVTDCIATKAGTTYSYATNSYLGSREGLTIVAGFPKGTTAVLEPKEYGKIHPGILILIAVGSFLWYIALPIWIALEWRKKGRDPKVNGPVRAWFDPPKTQDSRNLTPAETGALYDETVDMKDVQSTIIDLARRGYFMIVEKKKDDFYFSKTFSDGYVPKKTKEKDIVPLTGFEKQLLNGIFKTEKEEVRLKDVKLYTTVDAVKKTIYEDLTKQGFFERNPESLRSGYIALAVIGLILGFNLPLFISAMIFGRNMPRKTVWGAQQKMIAQSLKNFLTSQERQLEFQARNHLFFEKLLPFAVAFGVEKIWAKRFADIAKEPPEWYQGYYVSHYSTNALMHSMHSSFNQFSTSATPPSSTGHSSGFSGGSSGGGGGGGGGGSW